MNRPAASPQSLTDKLIAGKDGSIGWITFNNPGRHNATSYEMWQSLPVVLEAYVKDPEVRVIVFRGAGEKAFSAGADISQFKEKRSSAEAVKEYNAAADAANQALQMGLVNRVMPAGEIESYTRDYANGIAANAPLTIAAVKRSLIELQKDPAERDLARCQGLVDACFASEDYREGQTAFMEKRKPQFKGR